MAPKQPDDEDRDVLSRIEYHELVEATETPREEAILRVLAKTGLRVDELS